MLRLDRLGAAGLTISRALRVLRREGPRMFLVKAAAATCYSRLVVLERELGEPLPELTCPPGVSFGLLAPEDARECAELVPDTSAAKVREWLERGDRGFAVRQDGRIVGVSWAVAGEVPVDYLRGRLSLPERDVVVHGAYVAPELRRRRLASSAGVFRLRWLRDAGYRRAVCLILPENEAGFGPPRTLGYREAGHARSIGVGSLRLVFVSRRWEGSLSGLVRRIGRRLRRAGLEAALATAALHRRRLGRTVFIGVTGSCGKTTTKELIAAALAELPGTKNPGTSNSFTEVAKTVLRTTGHDRYCVVEVAAWEDQSVARAARVVQPDIAVVTNIGWDHRKAFRTLEAIAAEKRLLLDAVADGGTAVLNIDDENVARMGKSFPGQVVTFGCSEGAALRAVDVRSSWPDRLSFTLEYEGRTLPVQTNLCGRHWVTSVLAALGAATAMGIPIDAAVAALACAEPVSQRMSPVARAGITFLEDHAKAPFWTLDAVFEFLAEARARRKLLVMGTISDYAGSSARKYASAARRALAVSDHVVFVGPHAHHALEGADGSGPGELYGFRTLPEAVEHLRRTVSDGDLVLLEGSRADGLGAVVSEIAP